MKFFSMHGHPFAPHRNAKELGSLTFVRGAQANVWKWEWIQLCGRVCDGEWRSWHIEMNLKQASVGQGGKRKIVELEKFMTSRTKRN